MRILQLVKTSIGASWALRQMTELVKLGVEVHVALPTNGPLIVQYNENGIIVHELNWSLKGIVGTSKRLRKIMKEVKPDIIHSHFVLTTLIMRLALRDDRTPRIFQVPGPLHLENWFFRNLEIALAQKNDYWTGSCQWTCNRYIKSGIDPGRISLSYYGGYILNKQKNDTHKLRKELSLSEDTIMVGMVAYMYAPKRILGQKRGLKGHEDFIDAIKIVSEKYPNVYGICVGGAWDNAIKYEEKIKEYAKRTTPNILLCGTRNDIHEIYPEFSCAVHPSHSENLGGAAESLAFGIPTISSSVGGFPDIVIDGKTGYLINPQSPSEMARAIIKILDNKEMSRLMTEEGRKIVSEMLNINNTSRSMKVIYETILKKEL